VLQHVSLEVPPDDVRACVGFWERLGFSEITPPPTLRQFTWVERDGTQIHLIPTDDPAIAEVGHVAVLVADFVAALAALRDGGFAPEEAERAWGAARAFVQDPAGHRVELMAAAPIPPFDG
jgi:catechol 2,3-dioxygenase-like lactoylglutathione lyase family enzyme